MSAKRKKNPVAKNIDDKVFKDAIDDFDRIDDFVTNNWNKIVVASCVIGLAVIIGYLVFSRVKDMEVKSFVALSSAETIEDLNRALSEHPGSKGAALARLTLGTMYFNEGEYEKALGTYRALNTVSASDDLAGRARLNIGYTLEAMGRHEEAAESFSGVGTDSRMPDYVRKEANYSGGRIYLSLGKLELAKGMLKSIKIGDRGDFWESQAERMLQRIMAGDPVPAEASPAQDAPEVGESEDAS